MGAFLQGRQVAQQEAIHQQALEENKLRAMILKHQINGLKIEDTLRKRALQEQNLALMSNQPESSLPTEPVRQTNLPSTSRAGGMTGLPGVVSGLMQANAGSDQPGPSTMAAPAAQQPNDQLGTNMTTRVKPVTISGVPEWGVPDTQVTPMSYEDTVRRSIMQKMMEPFNLGPDQERIIGGQVVARGAPRTLQPRQPNRMTAALEATGGDPAKALELEGSTRGSGANANRLTPKDFLYDSTGDGNFEQASGFVDTKGNYFDADKNPIRNAAARIKPLRGTGRTANGGMTDAQRETANRSEYGQYARTYRQTNPAPTASERQQDAFQRSLPNMKDMPPLKEAPPPVSYDKWKVMTAEERQQSITNPQARITDKEMRARQQAATENPSTGKGTTAKPAAKAKGPLSQEDVAAILKGQPKGKRYTMSQDGSQWDLLPDGTLKPVE